ncbi:MAG: hypothetical protein WAS07_00400 [Micropruina sp.]
MRAPAQTRGWGAAAIASALVGSAIVAACLLAVQLELTGLGRPRDTSPRLGYLLLLALGVAGSVSIPTWLAWKGLGSWWPIIPVVMIVAMLAACVLLGV